MPILSHDEWVPLLGALGYVTEVFARQARARDDAGVMAVHGALTVLRDVAASHARGTRPSGLTSSLKYKPPVAPDVTQALTLELFPVDAVQLNITFDEEEP